ncbi:MAG: dipeptidase [Solirubrobacteraceae bacterium]
MIPIFDGHNDSMTREDPGSFATGRSGGHLDLPRMRAGGMRGGIFAIFSSAPGLPAGPADDLAVGDSGPRPGSRPRLAHPIAAADATAAAGRLLALERQGVLRVGRAVADVDAAAADSGPPVAVLHLEGAEAIDPGLESLELWYAAGLRSLGPVWSRPNGFAHGVPFAAPSSPDTGPGLTDAGVRLVRRCAELGILVDLSHMNEAGFWDVARQDVGPLVASHSGAHAICPTSRNLTDGQLDQIAASGGLVGIVFAPPFLRPDFADEPNTEMALIVEHARYVANRIGVEHVALGSDFDGASVPAALGDAAGLPRLLDELSAGGFSGAELKAIAWENWRRVLAAWWSA